MVCTVVEEKEFVEELRLSPVNLSHFDVLCDSVGMRQHAIHGVPLLESGYTVDDNARALVAMLDFGQLYGKETAGPHCVKFLSFLNHLQSDDGRFRNILSFDRRFLEEGGSGDCFGRAMWACGRTVNSWLDRNYKEIARKILEKALPQTLELEHQRPIAFTLIGLDEIVKARPDDRSLIETVEMLGNRLVRLFEANSDEKWQWFEDILTYDNARLPQAMFAAYQATGNKRFLEIAKKSFGFLAKETIEGEMFVPVGQDGWYPKGGEKALFDQQPLEAAAMVQAATAGFLATSDDDYRKIALTSFNWFFGGNELGAALYDNKTGACFDGLTPKEVNLNQGAESLVEFMISRFCVEKLKSQKI